MKGDLKRGASERERVERGALVRRSDALTLYAPLPGRIRHAALALVLGLVAVYIGFKYLRGRRRTLRVPRMTVDELRQKQEAGEALFVVDQRAKEENSKPQAPSTREATSIKPQGRPLSLGAWSFPEAWSLEFEALSFIRLHE